MIMWISKKKYEDLVNKLDKLDKLEEDRYFYQLLYPDFFGAKKDRNLYHYASGSDVAKIPVKDVVLLILKRLNVDVVAEHREIEIVEKDAN